MTNIQINRVNAVIGIVVFTAVMVFGIRGITTALYYEVYAVANEENSKINEIYVEECSACHLAYPPGLLPYDGWKKVMASLDDHFGDNAELDKETSDYIENYLHKFSLQKGKSSNLNRMLRNIPEQSPLRITKLPQFQVDHNEVFIKIRNISNEELTVSRCEDCHSEAEQGFFKEIEIPAKFKSIE